MRYLLLVYTDPSLLQQAAPGQLDEDMRNCLHKADELVQRGTLVDFQQLEPVHAAKSLRIRHGSTRVLDGPFAETKELLAGFNLVEADSIEQALEMAAQLPWARYGCIEVRPVADVGAIRRQVGA